MHKQSIPDRLSPPTRPGYEANLDVTYYKKYHHRYKAISENITSLLPSVLCSTASGNKRVIFFSHIAWYYGDNDFIIPTFDFIARSDAAHVHDL